MKGHYRKRVKNNRNVICNFCNYADEDIIQVHHIIPRSKGGNNKDENLLLLCPNCHRELHKKGHGEFIVNNKIVQYFNGNIYIFDEKTNEYFFKYLKAFELIKIGLFPDKNVFETFLRLFEGMNWAAFDEEYKNKLIKAITCQDTQTPLFPVESKNE